jgi:hypothetical protein
MATTENLSATTLHRYLKKGGSAPRSRAPAAAGSLPYLMTIL